MTLTEFAFLGWQIVNPPDVCWLDCEEPGVLERRLPGRSITLCRLHAEILERGRYQGSYAGAPLPPDTIATAWPWMLAQVA